MATAEDAEGARQTPPAGEVDLISGLDDDVLLRILALVPDARDAARAAASSRRWRRLWTRVPALRFTCQPLPRAASGAERCAALDHFVSLVNNILLRRTTQSDDCATVETLGILFITKPDPAKTNVNQQIWPEYNMERLMPASVDAAQGWIRYAFQHGVKSLSMDLRLPDPPKLGDVYFYYDEGKQGEGKKKAVVLLDELPSPVSLETMHLSLGGARLQLPTTMEFTSLRDLSLEKIRIECGGGARLFAHLVSSGNCPHLRKLHMATIRFPNFNEEMRLEAYALSELWLEDVSVMSLELRTPRLRVLLIDKVYHNVLKVSAPGLEEVALFFQLGCSPRRGIEIDGDLPCVRILKLYMWSFYTPAFHYGDPINTNAVNMLTLNRCSSITCLDVTLDGRKVFPEDVEIIRSRVPHLPRITSLTINVSMSFERHNFGAGVANLLTRFTNLERLSLHLPIFFTLYHDLRKGLGHLCNHPDHWISDEISMAHLHEVELTGLTGTDCELWLMKGVVASARGLREVAIRFNTKCWEHEGKMDAFERMLLDEGMWVSHRDKHTLTLHK